MLLSRLTLAADYCRPRDAWAKAKPPSTTIGDVLHQSPATADALTRRQERRHARHVVASEPVLQRSHAACTLRHVPADGRGRLAPRIGRDPLVGDTQYSGDLLDCGREDVASGRPRARAGSRPSGRPRARPHRSAHVPNQPPAPNDKRSAGRCRKIERLDPDLGDGVSTRVVIDNAVPFQMRN